MDTKLVWSMGRVRWAKHAPDLTIRCLVVFSTNHSASRIRKSLSMGSLQFSGQSLMEFWRHILSGCKVCDWGIQYHLCSIYRGLDCLGRVLVAQVKCAGFDSWQVPDFSLTSIFTSKHLRGVEIPSSIRCACIHVTTQCAWSLVH